MSIRQDRNRESAHAFAAGQHVFETGEARLHRDTTRYNMARLASHCKELVKMYIL
jgi:hypothetical protein